MLREENIKATDLSVRVYMLEIYNDQLIDLLENDKKKMGKHLDIKKDAQGMVFVTGATIATAETKEDLAKIIEGGFKHRHVSSTKMNAESSRSHLVFSMLLESVNKTTGAKACGKLSLVDLAGSERQDKTGATAERLKEAQSINKSLSALGDVISALSTNESFIPYRNNKLTLLMSDSLGGNAKTLMFVNTSPADYNADETTTSLVYAARVKLIVNSAEKQLEGKEVQRLKGIIKSLRDGKQVDEYVDAA